MQPRFKFRKHPVIPSTRNISNFIVATVRGTVDDLINLERRGTNPHHRGPDGWDAFLYAVNERQVDRIRLLVSCCGLHLNAKDRHGSTLSTLKA